MSEKDVGEFCPFCKHVHLVKVTRELTFHQMTDKGGVNCRVVVPVGTCGHCGFTMVGMEAEGIMAQAVRWEYNKLPPAAPRDE
jgi:hypothetical protein